MIETLLLKHRAILFRNFNEYNRQFNQLIEATQRELLEYRDRSSPRHEIAGKIYTSTDYPAEQKSLHNEGTYLTWPLKIYFGCLTAPSQEEKRRLPTVGMFSTHSQRLESALCKRTSCKCNYNDGLG